MSPSSSESHCSQAVVLERDGEHREEREREEASVLCRPCINVGNETLDAGSA